MTKIFAAYLATVLFFFGPIQFLPAQTTAPDRPQFSAIPKTVAKDFGFVVSAPLRMSVSDGLKTVAFVGLVAGAVYALDEPTDEEFAVEDHDEIQFAVFRGLARGGKVYDVISTTYFAAGLTGSMFAGSLILKDYRLMRTTGLMVEAFAFAQVIGGAGKMFFGRSRPFTEKDARDFNFFQVSPKRSIRSMPSGHTSSMFAMMTVLAKSYDRWWIKAPAYTLGAAVAFQRIESRNHWVSDVVVGAALGYVVGSMLVHRHQNRPGDKDLSVQPYLGFNQAGISFTLSL